MTNAGGNFPACILRKKYIFSGKGKTELMGRNIAEWEGFNWPRYYWK